MTTATTAVQTTERRGAPPPPVLGPTAKAACRAPINGDGRKLLVLLGAYHDAGIADPPVFELSRRTKLRPGKIDKLLDRLVADGLLIVHWAGDGEARVGCRGASGARNRYELRLPKTAREDS